MEKNKKPFVNNFIWKVFIHTCLGIHCLHSQNIVHRDLKTLNIFLAKDKTAKIGDFGEARETAAEENAIDADEFLPTNPDIAATQKVGTPYYMAPELWLDKICTTKSDIWALGVILF
jgi:NIMA (never in mitosis gene a)-related kinase